MAVWITCMTYSFLTTGFSSLKLTGVFRYNIYLCTFFSGSADAIGDVFFIFALKHALNSGTSPAIITTVLMFNVFIVLMAGIGIFKEQHEKIKYCGAALVFISLMAITSQREFDTQVELSEYQNDSYTLAIF
jgi:drug/metabolite transporter (DMT)-like permease